MQDFKIQNIVGSCDVKFPIRLEGLAYSHSYFCSVRILHAIASAIWMGHVAHGKQVAQQANQLATPDLTLYVADDAV